MPPETKPANPLLSVGGLVGAVAGWGLSQYCGATIWIPGAAAGLLILLFLKTPVHPRYFKGAIAACGGQVIWFTISAFLANVWMMVIGDIILLLGGIIWIWIRPGLAAAVYLGLLQLISLGVNIWRILPFEFGSLGHKALVAHIVFRLIAIACLFTGFKQMRGEAKNAVSPPPLPQE